MIRVWFLLCTTVALWLVAEFEALSYQGTPNFNKSENLETGTATAINYSACCMPQLVCPAMNQGTFKYRKLSVNQEECSLKLIHHNFKWDERHQRWLIYFDRNDMTSYQKDSALSIGSSYIGNSISYWWLASRIRFTGSVSNPPCGASLSRGWYWTAREKAENLLRWEICQEWI